MLAPARFPRRYGGRSTTETAAAVFRVAAFGSARAITSVTGPKGAPRRSRISPCSVAGTTARSMKRATGLIDSPTASFGSAARTGGFSPRSRFLTRCQTIPCKPSERGTRRRGSVSTRGPRPRGGSGSLLVSRTAEHAALVREEARQSQAWGVDVQLVDGDEAHRLMPLLESQGIRAACHTPGDVYIDEPSSLLQAYLEACRRQGVTLIPHTPVTGIRVTAGQVEGVVTAACAISARIV